MSYYKTKQKSTERDSVLGFFDNSSAGQVCQENILALAKCLLFFCATHLTKREFSCLLVASRSVVGRANIFSFMRDTIYVVLGLDFVYDTHDAYEEIKECRYCSSILSLVQFLFSFVSYSLSYINVKKNKGK